MKTLKRYLILNLAVMLLLLPSCEKDEYSDSLSCEELGDKIELVCADGLDYDEYDEEYLSFFFDDLSLCDDFCIIYSEATNDINEFGIFHSSNDENTEKTVKMAEDYIKDMQEGQRAFISSYAPEELPKLDSAEVRRFGRYVAYSIADPDTTKKAFSAIASALG